MGKIAFVFSGQGAQYSGMGESLYECSEAVKKLYTESEIIRPGTMAQSFHGTAEELKITKNTQPCLYLVDMAAALALTENGIKPDCVAGFSLGEIAALSYAGAYSYTDGFKIVTKRGALMHNYSAKYDTAMAAVLKIDSKTVETICNGIENIYPVNYNSAAQTVVAGDKKAIEAFRKKAADYSCRIIDLPVSAAFHSPYMNEASEEFSKFLCETEIRKPSIPVYSNSTALPYAENVKNALADQMKKPVLWQKIIENMIKDGVTVFIETGAGKTLSGLIKKISNNVLVYSVQDKETLLETTKAVKENA